MRRIKLVVAALAVVVATFAAFAGPAMAADRDDHWNWNHNNWNWNHNNWNWWNNGSWNWWNNGSNNGFICFDNGTASGCINSGGFFF